MCIILLLKFHLNFLMCHIYWITTHEILLNRHERKKICSCGRFNFSEVKKNLASILFWSGFQRVRKGWKGFPRSRECHGFSFGLCNISTWGNINMFDPLYNISPCQHLALKLLSLATKKWHLAYDYSGLGIGWIHLLFVMQ